MLKIYLLIVFSVLIPPNFVAGYHGNFKTCYECASKFPKNRICNAKRESSSTGKDPWLSACCPPDNKSPYCLETYYNICSPPYEQAGPLYYSYCAQTNMTMCGTTDSMNMTFTAEPEQKTFTFDGLRRYQKMSGKDDRFDACRYTFMSLPVGMY